MIGYYRNRETGKIEAKYWNCDTQSTKYTNPTKMYVAPAYICLSESPEWSSTSAQDLQVVFPGAKGETDGVYNLNGSTQITESKLLEYEQPKPVTLPKAYQTLFFWSGLAYCSC